MRSTLKVLGIAAALWCAAGVRVPAQGVQSGIIRGTVTSADGVSLPDATVTIKSAALQGAQTTTSDMSGAYVFRGLPPGTYAVEFSRTGMTSLEQPADVPLGGVAEVNVTLQLESVGVSIDVVAAQVPATLAVPTVGANFTHNEIEALATPRTLSGIASLAPGVTENSPTAAPTTGQSALVINGAFSFDNIFMLNGVDINDNLFAWPQNLFVEDAIQETQILTSGISAEFGRFSGGVVNAVTKSGGNVFSGSYRLNLSNDAWSTRTPFEAANNVTRISKVNEAHEATLGGPIVKDRLWFFLAGRYQNADSSNTLPFTGVQYVTSDNNKRGELKLTGTAAPGQTVQVSYLNDPRTVTNQANFSGGLSTVDPTALSDKVRPNHLFAVNYKGVVQKAFVEAQYSEMKFSTNLGGGTSRAIVDSPIINFDFTQQYNAPSSTRATLTAGTIDSSPAACRIFMGRHDLKGGYEWFRSQHTGGNSQSATGNIFYTDYATDASGNPVLDSSGRLQPLFIPNATEVFHYISTPGAVLNIDNNSLYGQDHWRVNPRLSLDLGVRFEKVQSDATGTSNGVDAHRTMPRLAAAFDPNGDGRYVFHVTYAHYSGRYDEALIGANSPVGNPIEIDGIYKGPAGQGRSFAAGFDPSNYSFANVFASFPTANVKLDSNLSSPLTKEFTLSAGGTLIPRLFAQATYVWRNTDDIIEDFISLDNGTTHVVQPGVDLTVTNRVFKNSDLPTREYQALLFQSRYEISRNWTIDGYWTLQLKDDGNYEGESSNQIMTLPIGDYPQIFNATQQYPTGRLQSFQRSKIDVWSIYNVSWGRWGDGSISGVWRYNSARVYSLAARVPGGVTAAQAAALASLGYPDAPQTQTVYYSSLGSESFAGYAVMDLSFNYNVPIYKNARPWLKVDVFNLFDNQKLINWDTTIKMDPSAPVDALGISSVYIKGPHFGQATGNTSFPTPFAGQTGGRTLRLAVGFRF